jgi:hypothetical protein
MILQCLCYNCERDFCSRSWFEKVNRRRVPHTLSDLQEVTRVEASNELLRILNDLEADSLMELQHATNHGFTISMNHRLYVRSCQVMSFQE